MNNKIVLVMAFLMSMSSFAGKRDDEHVSQSFFKYGVGIFNSAKNSAVEVKTLSVGHQYPLGSFFVWQWEVGGWHDTRDDMGRRGSAFADAALGLNVDVSRLYIQSFWGVAALTHKDAYLGERAQFNQDFSIGFKSTNGSSIGINYKHISSAGIFIPNQGRDFASIKLGIPW